MDKFRKLFKRESKSKAYAHRGTDDFEPIEIMESPGTKERRLQIKELQDQLIPLIEAQRGFGTPTATYIQYQKTIDEIYDEIRRIEQDQRREDARHGIPSVMSRSGRKISRAPRAASRGVRRGRVSSMSPPRRYVELSVSFTKRQAPRRDPLTGRFLPRRS